MNVKRIMKIIVIISIIILLMAFGSNIVYGLNYDPIENPNIWSPASPAGEDELSKRAGKILGIINVVGIVASVLCITALGIKYMVGSIEEKVDIKKGLVGYVVGIALLALCTTIPNIIYRFTTYDLQFNGTVWNTPSEEVTENVLKEKERYESYGM